MGIRAGNLGVLLVFIGTGCAGVDSRAPDPSGPSQLAIAPGDGTVEPKQTQYWCETHPEECHPGETGGEPMDTFPDRPGIWLGTTVTPKACLSRTGAGINDSDLDGIDERCEYQLASVFAPSLNLAPANYDCDPGKEPYWAAKWFPDQNDGVTTNGTTVRVIYLLSYYRDCGSNNLFGGILKYFSPALNFNNTPYLPHVGKILFGTDDPNASHSGDSEFITLDLVYSYVYHHWYVSNMLTSAHYHEGSFDGSRRTYFQSTPGIEWATGHAGGVPTVWVSKQKHANYISRFYCNDNRGYGGVAADNCDPNVTTGELIPVYYNRNIGSAKVNFISPLTCVGSQAPTFHPGTECFWRPSTDESPNAFNGWVQYAYGEQSTAYHSILVTRFECYQTTGQYDGQCIDGGVQR